MRRMVLSLLLPSAAAALAGQPDRLPRGDGDRPCAYLGTRTGGSGRGTRALTPEQKQYQGEPRRT